MISARLLVAFLFLVIMASCMAQKKKDIECVAIQCNSRHYKHAKCKAERYIRSIRLVKRHSKSKCVHGHSFGIVGSYVWVDHGCRATFEICF